MDFLAESEPWGELHLTAASATPLSCDRDISDWMSASIIQLETVIRSFAKTNKVPALLDDSGLTQPAGTETSFVRCRLRSSQRRSDLHQHRRSGSLSTRIWTSLAVLRSQRTYAAGDLIDFVLT